jgi:hypothetical protein
MLKVKKQTDVLVLSNNFEQNIAAQFPSSICRWDFRNPVLATQGGVVIVLIGSERGTSSHCPVCNSRKKVKGRYWKCPNKLCGFRGNRDVVGSANMHPIAFGQKIEFPTNITYLRLISWRSRCGDTRQSSLDQPISQAPVCTGELPVPAQSIGVV